MDFARMFHFHLGLPFCIDKFDQAKKSIKKELVQLKAHSSSDNLLDQEEPLTLEPEPDLLAEPINVVTRPDLPLEPELLVPLSVGNFETIPSLPSAQVSTTDDVLTNSPDLHSSTWVTSAGIADFTTPQFLSRLAMSDTDLLNSLPYELVSGCPHCMNQSLVERKTQNEEGKHYCSVCRKRVWLSPLPYYYESRTSSPQVAISRHRKYLTDRCSEKIDALRRQERLHVSPYLKGKAYFISIDSVDESAYTALSNKYEAYYADHVGLEPTTKLQIQLCSTGGNVFQAKRMISLINANQAITHIQASVLYSAAFYIYFNLTCSKELDADAVGMYHLSRSCHYVLENGKILDHYTDPVEVCKTLFVERVGLNKQEINQIMAGVDVYFNHQRLSELTHLVAPARTRVENKSR
ncbi:hypothetical protein [Spirosoma flavum]|uniref:Uncharacterized protein n=1 Tax=Spirosoma flavum TaxID=2048557 RepID=A0ABW6ALZ2_9BACT